jgi:hypothetical protein
MNWKNAHSLINLFVVILTLYAVYQQYTFVLPGGETYRPTLLANILWILTLLGFGWSSIALWTNGSDRGLEIAASLGIIAQTIYFGLTILSIINSWMIHGYLITQNLGGIITAITYSLILMTNFYFLSDNPIRDRIFTTRVLLMFDSLLEGLDSITHWRENRKSQRKPKPFYIHAGTWMGEAFALVVVVLTTLYLSVYISGWIFRTFFLTTNSQNAIIMVLIAGIVLIGGILAQVFVFFRRINLISQDSG